MKFTRLEIHRFRNIDAFSSDIDDGIVLFKGPNEAGKSSLLSALLFALFEDPKSSARRLEGAKGWNKESLYRVALTLSHNGETYVLEKDFENRSTRLRKETTDELWKNRERVNTKLLQIIGFFSKDVFTSTACVFQEELQAISSGQKEIRVLLEEKIAGGEDVAVEPVLRALEKKVLDLKRGLDRPAPVNPGQLRQTNDELKALTQRRHEVAERVSKLYQARERHHVLSEELGALGRAVEIKGKALEKSRQYVKAKEKHKDLKERLGRTLESFEKLSRAEQNIKKLKEEHEAKQKKLKESQAVLEKGRATVRLKAEKVALTLEGESEKQVLDKARRIVEEVDHLKKSLDSTAVIAGSLVQKLIQMESDVRALERSIGQRAMHLTVAFRRRTPYVIETEDGMLSSGEGTAGETIKGSAKKEVCVKLEDIAEVRVATKDVALEDSLKDLKQKKDFLEAQFKQYRCQSVAELASMKEKRDESERALRAREDELKVILGKETVETLAARVSELETRLKKLNESLEDVGDSAPSEEEVADLEWKSQVLSKEVQELEGNIRENQGIMKYFTREELEKERKDLATDIVVAERALDDLKGFEASGERVLLQENEVEGLERKLSDLKVERQALEHVLKEDRYGQEDVAELEERIESLERRAGRLSMRLKAYEVIREVLAEARRNILKAISRQVDDRIGAYFSLITGGRYNQVRLSRDDFSLQVFSPDKGDWIDPQSEELSTGARDQLYLAARLALLDVVCKGNAVPVILDDPLVHFDASRRDNTRKLLQQVSNFHQVLILSCHDYYDAWADQIITF